MSFSSTASLIGSMRRSGFVAFGVAALFCSPIDAVAQDPNLVDQGRYDITVGDHITGTETFAIRRQGEGYMAVGRIQLEGESTWLRSALVFGPTAPTLPHDSKHARSVNPPIRSN